MAESAIPVIDMGPYRAGGSAGTKGVEAVGAAGERIGFLVIAGHGASPQVVESARPHRESFEGACPGTPFEHFDLSPTGSCVAAQAQQVGAKALSHRADVFRSGEPRGRDARHDAASGVTWILMCSARRSTSGSKPRDTMSLSPISAVTWRARSIPPAAKIAMASAKSDFR